MIRLEHVTKYFNKGKVNEFAVCKDISLTFSDTGLVVILGPSGSGKTTLLNVISGMDRFDSGSLVFDDATFRKYSHRKWDQIRKHKIGYVYQSYYLIKEMSVYKNIEPVLRMQGIEDEPALRQHVDRLLLAVGMENYADRLVRQLSGGQQQRVAFARALANNPQVILADEPTGNLDGKTTIEVMNVIKEISRTRLVILVTHEQSLSDFYADRIITLESGTIISDRPNDNKQGLDFIQEHIIDLKDYSKTEASADNLIVSRYVNKDQQEPLDVDLIERNQTLYVKINSRNLKRIKYIDSDSEIVVNDSSGRSDEESNPFVMSDIYPEQKPKKDGNVFGWRDIFRYALRKMNVLRSGSRMFFLVLMLVGAVFAISIGLVGEIYHVEEPYSAISRNYITVNFDKSQYADVQELETVPGVDELVLVGQPFMFSLTTEKYYEIHSSIQVLAQPVDILFFDPAILIYGELPSGYEIVIDKSVADDIIYNNADRGILTYDDVLNCKFKLTTSGTDLSLGIESSLNYAISGIADDNSKSVWMKEELMYSLVTPYLVDYRVLGDNFAIESGDLPDSSGYIMLNENFPTVKAGSIPYNVGFTTGTYYVSGVYSYKVDGVSYDFQKAMVTSLDFIKFRFFLYDLSRQQHFTVLVYATDVETTLKALTDAGYSAAADLYKPSIAQQIKLQENRNFYLLGLGGILMSAFCIFLIMRSSLISRMYEVSVFRSVGVSRKEIRRIFLVEILLTTAITSVIGFLVTVLVLDRANASLEQFAVTYFTGWAIIFGVIGLFAVNMLVGLIPINLLLMKTPASILKRTDL